MVKLLRIIKTIRVLTVNKCAQGILDISIRHHRSYNQTRFVNRNPRIPVRKSEKIGNYKFCSNTISENQGNFRTLLNFCSRFNAFSFILLVEYGVAGEIRFE